MYVQHKKTIKTIIVLAILCVLMIGSASAMSGSGTSDDPYIITSAQDLQDISSNPSSYYELGADISMSGFTWTSFAFSGYLDGNDHVISDLTTTGNAMFTTSTGGSISNIILDGATSTGTAFIVDTDVSTPIDNVIVRNSYLSSTSGNVGGIAGTSSSNANIAITNNRLENSYISTTGAGVGGIVGYYFGTDSTDYLYNNDVVNSFISGGSKVGGVVGYFNHHNALYDGWASPTNCYLKESDVINTIIQSAGDNTGGIAGYGNDYYISSGGSGVRYSHAFTLYMVNCTVESCYIYSSAGTAGGFMGWGGSQNTGTSGHYTEGSLNNVNGLINNTVVQATTTVYPFTSAGINGATNTYFTNGNYFGASNGSITGGTIENSVSDNTLFNQVNCVAYSPDDVEVAEKQIDIYVLGSSVNLNGNSIQLENVVNLGDGTTLNNQGNTLNHTYDSGTYTVSVQSKNYFDNTLSTAVNSPQFTVQGAQVLPEITDETATPSTILQRGSTTISLSATITAPSGHEVSAIQWKYSTDNITFSNIAGATTSSYTWTPAEGNYYVKVSATNDAGTTDSSVIQVTVYGMATITSDSVVPLNVELGNSITVSGSYTPSTNPVPNTYSCWFYSSDGESWNEMLAHNVNEGNYTFSSNGTYYVRYGVGDTTYMVFSFNQTHTVNVQPAEQVSISANKTSAGVNENVRLTGVISSEYEDTHIWQSSTDNSTFVDISGATGLTYDFTTQTAGVKYYRLVSTNAFGTYTSNVVNVSTYGSPTVSATVSPLTANINEDISLTGTVTVDPVLGDNDYTVSWQSSNNGGSSWSEISTSLTDTTSYASYGEYKIKLVVTDAYYTVESTVYTVNIVSAPTISDVQVSPIYLGEGMNNVSLSATITSSTGSHTTQWQYSTNNGTSWSDISGATSDSYTWVFPSMGIYKVRVSATNTHGTVYSVYSDNVTVYGAPSVDITLNKTASAINSDINIITTVTNPAVYTPYVVDVQVSYNGGEYTSISNSENAVYTLTQAGTYSFKSDVATSYIHVYSEVKNCTVYSAPTVSINTPSENEGKVGDTLTLSATVTSDLPTTKVWSYENVNTSVSGTIASSNSTSCSFTLPVGAYIITLTATSDAGSSSDTYSYLSFYGVPSVSMTALPASVSVGDSVTLSSTPVINATLGKSDYNVYYQNKQNNEWVNCSTPFTTQSEGTYEFRAVMTDEYYTVYSSVQSVECANTPVITGQADASNVSVGSTVGLSGTITSSVPITAYTWQVQNGENWSNITTSATYTASYTTSTAGVYSFRLMGANSHGTSYSSVISVTAQEARTITATISPNVVEVGESVSLTATITTPQYVSPIASQVWEVSTNGGSTWSSTGISALSTSYTLSEQSVYSFRYKIVDTLGITSLSNIVTSTAGAVPTITLTVPSNVQTGVEQTFSAGVVSTLPVLSTEWFVDDVSIGTGYSVKYTFPISGTHTVKFTASNVIGESYQQKSVVVMTAPYVNNLTVLKDTVEYGTQQTAEFKTNVNSNQITVQQKYMDGYWENVGAQISFSGDTFTAKWNVYTDEAEHGGTMYTRVYVSNSIGSALSDVVSFTVGGKVPTNYEKTFEKVDANAQIVMLIAGLVMLVIIGILMIGVVGGNMDIGVAVKSFLIVGAIVIVLTFMIIFIGSMAGVITVAL